LGHRAGLPLVLLTLAVASLLLPGMATAASSSAIKGTVSAPVPVGEVEVCLVEALPSETCVHPGSTGEYTLAVPEAGIYQVEFLPSYASHLVTQYYNHKAKLSEANKVVVPANANVTGIDAALELGGVIEGQVTDAISTTGLESVEVCAQDATTRTAVSCSHTDANGNYALPSVPPGSYRVGFWGERESAAYAPQYYEDKPSFVEATPLQVAEGETVTGIDAQLATGARVSGTVTDSSGAPLASIAVCILQSAAAGPERCTYTDPNGQYALPGVASGTYQVAFSPEFNEFAKEEFVLPEEDGWHTQYYEGSSSREGSTTLTLNAPEQRQDIDAALLTTYVPPSPPPLVPAPSTAIPPPPIANTPPAARKNCGKGFKRRKVKGKVRCVKAHKHRGRHKKG
jgi:hypothetical protein